MILGSGDKGKTRLIANMATHDITANDRAVVVIDSDGGLIDDLTRWISAQPNAKELVKRVILIDPTYPGGALGYNPLEMPEDGDMQSAASAIVYGFKSNVQRTPWCAKPVESADSKYSTKCGIAIDGQWQDSNRPAVTA